MAVDPLEPSACLRCRRILSRGDRRYDQPKHEPDHCGFCGVPLTRAARDRQRPPGVATREVMAYGFAKRQGGGRREE